MKRERSVLVLLAALALGSALLAAGCGEDEGSGTTAAQGTGAQGQGGEKTQRSAGNGGRADRGPSAGGSQGAASGIGLGAVVEDPSKAQLGIKAGYDNSIQTYGTQAEGDERDEVIRTMRAFFATLAAEGVEDACAYFSENYKQSLADFSSSVQPGEQEGDSTPDCTEIARFMLRTSPKGALKTEARKGTSATVLRVGIEEDTALITMRTRKGRLSYFVMNREDGEWKVGSLVIAPLRPAAP